MSVNNDNVTDMDVIDLTPENQDSEGDIDSSASTVSSDGVTGSTFLPSNEAEPDTTQSTANEAAEDIQGSVDMSDESEEGVEGEYDDDSDAEIDKNWKTSCLQVCRPRWLAVHEKSEVRKHKLAQAIILLKQLSKRLDEQNKIIEEMKMKPKPRRTKKTWPDELLKCLRGPPELQHAQYIYVYKLSCRESNIPPHPERVLPGLTLRGPNPLVDCPVQTNTVSGTFRFEQLSLTTQVRILQMALCFYGEKVHVLSRLDPFEKPSLESGVLGSDPEKPQLLHRLHIGEKSVSLTYATLPMVLLAPLLVCKRWHFWGCHLFYGENKFCFSSLGEWGRFAAGIKVRLQCLRQIEILWQGSQLLTYEKSERQKYTSRRTQPLMWLPECIRLQEIDVHLPESSEVYMRRKHEPRGVIKYMTEKTKDQPNYRKFRSLRTLQGLDYVHCLRGMKRVSFWDHTLWIKHGHQCPVRDSTFQLDVNTTVRQPKNPANRERERLDRVHLLQGYEPSPDVWRALMIVVQDVDCQPDRQEVGVDEEDVNDNNNHDDGNNEDEEAVAPENEQNREEQRVAQKYLDSGSDSGSSSDNDENSGDEIALNQSPVMSTIGSPLHFESVPRDVLTQSTSIDFNNAVDYPPDIDIGNEAIGDLDNDQDVEPQGPSEPIDLTIDDGDDDDDDDDGYDDDPLQIDQSQGNSSTKTMSDDGVQMYIQANQSLTMQNPEKEETELVEDTKPAQIITLPSIDDQEQDAQRDEGSLFVSDAADPIDLTLDDECRGQRSQPSPSPTDALRAMEAHIQASRNQRNVTESHRTPESDLFVTPTPYQDIVGGLARSTGSRSPHQWPQGCGPQPESRSGSESGLFCSPTRYSSIVRGSTNSDNNSERGIHQGNEVHNPVVDLTGDSEAEVVWTPSPDRRERKRSHDEGEEDPSGSVGDGSPKRNRAVKSFHRELEE